MLSHLIHAFGVGMGRCARGTFGVASTLVLALTNVAVGDDELPAKAASDAKTQPFYFSLPAPRGQILDRLGRPLARTTVVHRLLMRVPPLKEETAQAYEAWVQEHWAEIALNCPLAVRPDAEALKEHFEHRRRLPVPISPTLRGDPAGLTNGMEGIEVQAEYARDYPGGTLAAHVLGYVTATGAPLKGPLQSGESLWMPVEGRDGLEASMNADLTGEAGTLLVSYDKESRKVQQHVMKAPVAGQDVVTTLDLEMQSTVEKALASANRPGSMVIVDVYTGSVLAMASAPTFDPAMFIGGLNQETFDKMKADEQAPLFNRAISSLYPPGSVFKPFVALAGLREGRMGLYDRIPCGPELMIDGRAFRNWSDTDQGWFDVNAALVRSCNTFFYQAAIATGDQPILQAARDFGFGMPCKLPLAGVAQGNVPTRVVSSQAQANLGIGQGEVLTSPLEVVMAMATLAEGSRRLRPRLVSQIQDQKGVLRSTTEPEAEQAIRFPLEHLKAIHSAMYSVVNHREGTAGKARVKSLPVYGKTGTAQWARDGEMVNAVWFAGFVKDTVPPLAFAIALEGRKGEKLFGGSAAAPLAGKVLASIAAAPQTYGLRVRPNVSAPTEDYPLDLQMAPMAPAYALDAYGNLMPNQPYGYAGVMGQVNAYPSSAYAARAYTANGSPANGYSAMQERYPEPTRYAVPEVPPGYELRYENSRPERRTRQFLSFPRR